jgi:hypothetical protein
MAAKKRIDPMKQREKRVKIVAIAGMVLFLAVAAYEVPSVLKMLNQKPPPGAYATDAGNRNPDGSIPLPNVSRNTGINKATGELADTDAPPQADGAQLVAFSVFDTKNPFTPQVTTPTQLPTVAGQPGADVRPGSTTTTTTPTTTTTTSTTTTPGTVPGGTVVPGTGTTTTTTTAAPSTVAISVNGVVSHVASQGTFPTATPVFRLVSFTKDSAQIGIVGGSYAVGGQTITLQLGHAVTLQNTTDQKMYKLELVATH